MNDRFFKKPYLKLGSLRHLVSFLLLKVPPKVIFLIVFGLTIFWATFLPSLKFNYNIENFFFSEDNEVAFYYAHRDTFENENDFVLVGLKNHKGIFQKDFLEKTDSLTKELKRIDRIKKVISPTNLSEAIKTPFGGIKIPIVHINEPETYLTDKNKIYESDLYVNSFFSADTLAVSLLLRKESNLPREVNDSLLFAINDLVNAFGFDEFHIAGRIQTQHYYVSNMKNQMGTFALLAIILFLISLFIIFRNVRYVILSFVTVVVSLIWIFGIIGWLDISIDLMLTLLPALVLIISTSSSIHLITRFKNEYLINVSKQDAIKKAVQETAIPNFLNALTTAIGFGSLILIPVAPIQQFGLLVALGLILSFLVHLFLIPAALRFMPLKAKVYHADSVKKGDHIFLFPLKRPIITIGISTSIIVISIVSAFMIQINNHFLDDLHPESSIKRDLDFFDDNFSGIRPFEINIQAKDSSSILSYAALLELDTIEHYLKSNYEAGFLFSPLTIIKSINKSIHGGNKEQYRLPNSQQELDEIIKLANKRRLWKRFLPVINSDFSVGRITGRTKDVGSLTFGKRNKKLEQFLKENTKHLKITITGAAHLIDNANEQIASNLAKGMLIAILVATLIIGFFTASWKLALLSLIPNLFPLLLVLGFMGVVGIPLKVSTSLIFTIVYGIAVDDTIHFLNSYRLNKRKYNNHQNAIEGTLAVMWKPMLYTSLVLFSGFMIFTLSEFSSISLLGYLVSASMVIALLADLILLPALLKFLIKS